MAILVFQHSDIGTAGRLGATLRDHGFGLDIRRPDLNGVGPRGAPTDLDNVHGIVILGGPQNVTDIEKHPWMQQEAAIIRLAHARELPMVGICLGAQLIAHALGGQVAPREKPAVGFYPVSVTAPGQTDSILAGLRWEHQSYFSCGQEIKQLPPGATLLMTSKHTKHVAFKAGVRTLAFICHFEFDRPLAEAITQASRGELARAGLTEGEVRVQVDQEYERFARLSDRLCVNIATQCFPVVKRLSA